MVLRQQSAKLYTRWFESNYGHKIRKFIMSSSKLIEKIIECDKEVKRLHSGNKLYITVNSETAEKWEKEKLVDENGNFIIENWK